ncbi:MAG: FKBP-type peptidyl-prolyl cis-trans isomerase, partial [Clostridia bacterium]|nr:FKBP-type peptidyl-prolyl cis-trans isomerase [Clostridia bacterium]
MKKSLAFTAFLLTLALLLSACGQKEKETDPETAEETVTEAFQGMTDADHAYLKAYLSDYAEGKLVGEKLFDYQGFEEFVKPFEYKGLTYPEDSMIDTEITDEEVDDFLTLFVLATQVTDEQYQELTEGTVQKYDMAIIDFRGVVDGQESDNTSGTDQELVIGSGTFIDGFESGLIGKNIGEEVKLDLKFSPYYGAREMAGKDATFYVTVKKVQRAEIPVLTAEDINAYYKTEFKSMDEAKAWFKEALGKQAESEAFSCISTYLQGKILESMEVVQYPEKEVEHFAALQLLQHEYARGDDDWEVYSSEKLGMSYEELKNQAELAAKEEVKPSLMMY